MFELQVLRRCTIITKGKSCDEVEFLNLEHIWWLLNGSTKQYLAAYYSEREKSLRELSLKQCVQIWGANHDCRFINTLYIFDKPFLFLTVLYS